MASRIAGTQAFSSPATGSSRPSTSPPGGEELVARARLSGLSGPLQDREAERVLEGFWVLQEEQVIGVVTNDLFVRKTGVVEWLSRLAERRPAVYGAMCFLIAVAAGWTAGTLFGRSGH